MSNNLIFIIVLFTFVYHLNATVTSEECQKKPAERHCIIEYASRDRFPHVIRYVYDWATRRCLMFRWSTTCAEPVNTNMFSSESLCYNECGGWA